MLLLAASLALSATIELDHQARLVDGTGAPVNGTVDLELVLRDGSTEGATELARQSFTDVDAQGGYVGVVLSVDSTAFAHPEVWVEYFVDDTSLGQRRLSRTPQAAAADVAMGVASYSAGEACDTSGQIRYDAASNALLVCGAGGWQGIQLRAELVQTELGARYADGTYAVSCLAYFNALSAPADGRYAIQPPGYAAPVPVYCDMSGGGWTVIRSESSSADGDVANFSSFQRSITVPAGVASQAAQELRDHGFSLGSNGGGNQKTVWLDLNVGFTFSEMQGSWVGTGEPDSRHHDDNGSTSSAWLLQSGGSSTGSLQFGTVGRVVKTGGDWGANWNQNSQVQRYTFSESGLSDSVIRWSVIDQSTEEYVDFEQIELRLR